MIATKKDDTIKVRLKKMLMAIKDLQLRQEIQAD